jgi:ABC-type transporter Mla subunit MlaD
MNTKFAAIVMLFLFSAMAIHAQDKLTRREKKQIALNINRSLEQLDGALEDINWERLGNALVETVSKLDQHADDLVDIIEQVDTEKMTQALAQIATNVERSVDLEKVEQSIEKLEKSIEKKLDSKK